MKEGESEEREQEDAVRLDKWLWAARFFKTRSLAAEAINGGRVAVNGERVRRSRLVHVGDEIRITKGGFTWLVHARQVSAHRGGAQEAAQLYEETAESRRARERIAEDRKLSRVIHEGGRPSKKDRRQLRRLRGN